MNVPIMKETKPLFWDEGDDHVLNLPSDDFW